MAVFERQAKFVRTGHGWLSMNGRILVEMANDAWLEAFEKQRTRSAIN